MFVRAPVRPWSEIFLVIIINAKDGTCGDESGCQRLIELARCDISANEFKDIPTATADDRRPC